MARMTREEKIAANKAAFLHMVETERKPNYLNRVLDAVVNAGKFNISVQPSQDAITFDVRNSEYHYYNKKYVVTRTYDDDTYEELEDVERVLKQLQDERDEAARRQKFTEATVEKFHTNFSKEEQDALKQWMKFNLRND